jgi:hypothetical protein
MKRKILTWRQKLGILEEFDEGDISLKACSRKHNLTPKSFRKWRLQRVEVLATAAAMADATTIHQYLNRQTLHSGQKPTESDILDRVLTMYHGSRDNDRIVTLNMLVAEVRRMDSGVKDLSRSAILHRIYRNLCKDGTTRNIVTRVAHNTRYDAGAKAGYVAFVNTVLKVGNYKASDIVNVDETNIDFDLVSRSTLTGYGERTSDFATTGCSSRCTVLLVVAMDGEKLPPYNIFKGANTPQSQIKK